MKVKYGTHIRKSRQDVDRPMFVKLLLEDASRTLGKVDKITLPLVITISEEHDYMQWCAEMED